MAFLPRFLLLITAVCFAGCGAPSAGSANLGSIRKVFVTDTQRSGVVEADALADAVHDAAARELGRLGFVATATPSEAQAILRSSWRVNKADDGRVSVALSISLFDPSGHRLLTTDSGTALSINFWNESSVRRAVEQALVSLPPPPAPPSAQK